MVSPSASDNNPTAGASFTLSATVSNAGDGESAATTLRYYRSTDGTITTSDTEVGTDAVAGLAASGSDSQSVELVAPSAPGTYHYGACVDAVAGESDTTNNCSTAVEVTVLVTQVSNQGSPDLEVGTPTVSDAGPAPGGSFTLSATVSNTGDGGAPSTTLRYYRSTDGTITTTDTAVGTDAVGALGASGTSAESISLTASGTAGAYYYGACVDTVTGESDTTDNCSGSVKVDVEAPKYPDLEVGTPTVSDRSPATGVSFTLSATVSNAGDGESVTTTLRYYRSTDGTITTTDTAVGTDAVGALAASGTSAQSISLTAPATAGAYYYGACVDTVTDESDTTDNCSGSVKVDVEVQRASRIELTPSSLSFAAVGETAIVTATVYDADNNKMPPTSWGWSVGDKEVATVNGSFLISTFPSLSATVQAIREGTTTVTLSVNESVTESATVTVTLPTARVDVSPGSLTFDALGQTKSVTVRVLDENGDEDEDATFNFFSSFSLCCMPNIADPPKAIDIEKTDDGLEITAEGPGTGRITISSTDVESAILLISVVQQPSTLEVSPASVSLAADGTATLSAAIKDANGHSVHVHQDDGRGGLVVYWETSDDEVATVEGATAREDHNTGGTATVTGVAAGTAMITGRWGGSSVRGTATVTVTD